MVQYEDDCQLSVIGDVAASPGHVTGLAADNHHHRHITDDLLLTVTSKSTVTISKIFHISKLGNIPSNVAVCISPSNTYVYKK